MKRLVTIIAASAWNVTFAVCALADQTNHDVALLARHGILPTAESIGEYLQSLHPDGDARRQVALLIEQLGDPSYSRSAPPGTSWR